MTQTATYIGRIWPLELEAALRRWVIDAAGYVEQCASPVVRRELPGGRVVLILGLGEAIGVGFPDAGVATERVSGFVSGLADTWARTVSEGYCSGIQLDLAPCSARALLGVDMSELANRFVSLDDLPERGWFELQCQLADLPDWDSRFAKVRNTLQRRIADAPRPPAEISWAWRQLDRSAGCVRVEWLAAEIGWSRRHFAARFREHIGLSPKAVARMLRFEHARLRAAAGRPWAEVAAESGYHDQSHLVRDCRSIAGVTPSELLAEQLGAPQLTLVS